MNFDHILFVGFGGPTKKEEIRPFLENVTRGLPIPEERLRDVEHHYHAVGGYSPYNECTIRLINKLRKELDAQSIKLPVFLGMRNWHPLLKDIMGDIKAKGLKRGIAVILAPHRSDASYEKYIRNVEDAKEAAGARHIEYTYVGAWHDDPLFIEAQADEISNTLDQLPAEKRSKVPVVFCAHSIPVEMAQKSRYVEEVRESSELVAKRLGLSKWQVAWQSRSGNPRQPWLEPDVLTVSRKLKEQGETTVTFVPIGFLCDNVEVLFDLDIEAKQIVEELEMKYLRAPTVGEDPRFVSLFVAKIQKLLASK